MIRRIVVLLTVATFAAGGFAADDQMTQVLARIKALEEKNADLETKLKAAQATPHATAAVDKAVEASDAHICHVITAPEGGGDCGGKCRDLKIGGYLDTSYQFNLSRPANFNNNQRVFDTDSNGFNLHLAELTFDRLPSDPGQAGFRIDTAFGTDARVIASQDNTSPPGARNAQFEVVDLKQAYIEYIAGVGCDKGITIDMGKFVTWMGAEVIESSDNMNASRSFLFGAIPFTHTGLRATYTPFKDKLTVGLGVVNGWDDIQNQKNSPTGIFEANWTATKWFNMVVTGTVGNEQFVDERARLAAELAAPSLANPAGGPNTGGDPTDPTIAGNKSTLIGRNFDPTYGQPRGAIDTTMTFTPWEKFTFVGYGLFVTEGRTPELLPEVNTPRFHKWYGGAAYAKYQFLSKWYVAGRYEYFADPDGVRTLRAQDLQSATLTTDYAVTDPLHIRFEYRRDYSNATSFTGQGTLNDTEATDPNRVAHPFRSNHQDTIMMQWLYKF
jgi:hypothetical protein